MKVGLVLHTGCSHPSDLTSPKVSSVLDGVLLEKIVSDFRCAWLSLSGNMVQFLTALLHRRVGAATHTFSSIANNFF